MHTPNMNQGVRVWRRNRNFSQREKFLDEPSEQIRVLSFENTQINLVFCSLIRNFAGQKPPHRRCLLNQFRMLTVRRDQVHADQDVKSLEQSVSHHPLVCR